MDPQLKVTFERVKEEVRKRAPELNFADLEEHTGVIVVGALHPTTELCNALHDQFGPFIRVEFSGPSGSPVAGRADWWVDPGSLPLTPETTAIGGFILERECASGQSPEGRIVGPDIDYRPGTILVTFRVIKIGGRCPSNPPFPVTVQLTEPLGMRLLLDGGADPPRDATIDPTEVLLPTEDCGPLVGTGEAKVACIRLAASTVGESLPDFAAFEIRSSDETCEGDACTTTAGIEARVWIVRATDRAGMSYQWSCTYQDETATCSVLERST